jgi:small subunit ribosomal protein S35
MAAAVNSFRLCLRATARQVSIPNTIFLRPIPFPRAISTTPIHRAAGGLQGKNSSEEEGEEDDEDMVKQYEDPGEALVDLARDESLGEDERKEANRMLELWRASSKEDRDSFQPLLKPFTTELAPLRQIVKPRRGSFWNDEESDTELITDEVGEDDFEEDDILSMGHGKLEEHREMREYARRAVWELPLLSSQ